LLGGLLAAELAPKLGQKVIVENRVGQGGNFGPKAGAFAAPNGYYLLVSTNAVLINPLVDQNVMYDPLKGIPPSV
jgi:tripartite-type tricarboxylate transporter receptor subunit TctC